MEELPNGVDDDIVQSLAGSPSDALFGLEPADLATTFETNNTNDDTTAPEATSDLDGAKIPVNAAANDSIPDHLTADITHTITENNIDEQGTSIELENTAEASVAIMPDLAVAPNVESEDNLEKAMPKAWLCPVEFEIALPYFSPEERAKYVSITSNVVDEIIEEVLGPQGELWYNTEFTDGRQEIVSISALSLSLLPMSNAISLGFPLRICRFQTSLAPSSQYVSIPTPGPSSADSIPIRDTLTRAHQRSPTHSVSLMTSQRLEFMLYTYEPFFFSHYLSP